jgi:hypothetical protein
MAENTASALGRYGWKKLFLKKKNSLWLNFL